MSIISGKTPCDACCNGSVQTYRVWSFWETGPISRHLALLGFRMGDWLARLVVQDEFRRLTGLARRRRAHLLTNRGFVDHVTELRPKPEPIRRTTIRLRHSDHLCWPSSQEEQTRL